tara:strand:+ start:437 stop:739 length:303 start_codon:yes stop_codon:yes gene_type:complete
MKKKSNPVAKELMTPQYKPRVKESRKTYRRDWELEEDILDDGDFVIDGYEVADPKKNKSSADLDDVNLDLDDYEYKQEEYDLESENAEPIAVDRYFRRIR